MGEVRALPGLRPGGRVVPRRVSAVRWDSSHLTGATSADYMEPNKFIEKAKALYRNARQPKFKHINVSRGLSHSISGALEDLMAFYLAENDTSDRKFFVDQTVNVNGRNKRPDIVIWQGGVAENFVDLKTDPAG